MTDASDIRMTVRGFKTSPAEAQQEHARLQSNRLKNGTPREGVSAPPLPSRLTSRFFGSGLKPIATTGEAADRADLVRGRTTTPAQSMPTEREDRTARERDRERCDTSTGSDEEESRRKTEGERRDRGRQDKTTTQGRDSRPFKNLSVSGGSFITPLYWYHYTTNQPTNQQVVVSPVIPRLSSRGVAA